MAPRKPPAVPADPPEGLGEAEAQVWRDVVTRGRIAPAADAHMLEAYCALVVQWRDASSRVAEEGIVVDGGDKRGAIVHPALAAERQLSQQLREWGPLFNRPSAVSRRSGPMYDATKRSLVAAKLTRKDRPEFEGACEAVLTLAWLLDEAQREGIDALQKAAVQLLPHYIKGCGELQITPADAPTGAQAPASVSVPPENDIEQMRTKLGRGA